MPPLRLPEFSMIAGPSDLSMTTETGGEGAVAAFEDGYKAGWEDAATAQSDAKTARDAEVAQHLQTIAFGMEEARQHVLRALEPLVLQIVGTVLPEMARVTLAPVLAETIMPLAERMAGQPIRLRVAPDARASVEEHLSRVPGLPIEIAEDPALSDGCVQVIHGPIEQHIDLDAVAATVLQTVQAFFHSEVKERQDAG